MQTAFPAIPIDSASREKCYRQIQAAVIKYREIKENINEGLKFYVTLQVGFFSVAANTIDKDLQSNIVLGDNKVIKGEGIHFGNVSKSPVYPLVLGKSANNADASEGEARVCESGSLDQEKVKGKIVLCENVGGSYYASNAKEEVKSKGDIGCIFVDDSSRVVASAYGSFPTTVLAAFSFQY